MINIDDKPMCGPMELFYYYECIGCRQHRPGHPPTTYITQKRNVTLPTCSKCGGRILIGTDKIRVMLVRRANGPTPGPI